MQDIKQLIQDNVIFKKGDKIDFEPCPNFGTIELTYQHGQVTTIRRTTTRK